MAAMVLQVSQVATTLILDSVFDVRRRCLVPSGHLCLDTLGKPFSLHYAMLLHVLSFKVPRISTGTRFFHGMNMGSKMKNI